MSAIPPAQSSFWTTDATNSQLLPVARPLLPRADELLPYLRQIDETRWYSNGGRCVLQFEERLAEHCGGGEAQVATVANATIGLTLALLALGLPEGSLCMVPSWTFVATGHAIRLAGLVPWIVDVNAESWALEAEAALAYLPHAPGQVSAVMPVSPFGAPVAMESWEKFHEHTGVAVLSDAAAAFDRTRASKVPAVISLHATKTCGVGEGGFVLSTDGPFIEEVQKRANFGFWNSREATVPSCNGKLSEYAAAVGLASLDSWPEIRADFHRVATAYRTGLSGQKDVQLQPGLGEAWVSSTIMVASATRDAEALSQLLVRHGIGSRRWWGGGLHRHRSFAESPRMATPATEALAARTIGLPCWRDLPDDQIARICEVLLDTGKS